MNPSRRTQLARVADEVADAQRRLAHLQTMLHYEERNGDMTVYSERMVKIISIIEDDLRAAIQYAVCMKGKGTRRLFYEMQEGDASYVGEIKKFAKANGYTISPSRLDDGTLIGYEFTWE